MAKTSTGKVQIVRVPSFNPAMAKAKFKGLAKRGGSAAAALARDEAHTLTAMAAGAALGYVESRAIVVPHIRALGIAGTYGGLAWGIARYSKNKMAAHVATGLLTCAIRDAVASSAPGAPGAPAVTGDGGMF
jgi:hypothetical protein